MKVSSRSEVEGDHIFLMGETSIDNLDCSDGEFDSWDMSLFGSLALEIGSLGREFYMVELGIYTQEGVLGISLHISIVGSNTLVGR